MSLRLWRRLVQIEVVGGLSVIVVYHTAPILRGSAVGRVVAVVVVRRTVVTVDALRLLLWLLLHVVGGLRRRHILPVLVDVLHRLGHRHRLWLLMLVLLLVGIAAGRTGAVRTDWSIVSLRKMRR